MPTYEVAAPDGRRFHMEGDSPPSEADLDEIFKASPASSRLESPTAPASILPASPKITDSNPWLKEVSRPPEPLQLETPKFEGKIPELSPEELSAASQLKMADPNSLQGIMGKKPSGPDSVVPETEGGVVTMDSPTFPLGDLLLKDAQSAKSPTEAGIIESLRPTLNGLTSRRNIAYMLGSMGVASTGKVAGKLVSALWTAFMTKEAVKNTPEIWRELGNEMGKPEDQRDQSKIAKLLTDSGTHAAFAVGPALHLAKGESGLEHGPENTAEPVRTDEMAPVRPAGESVPVVQTPPERKWTTATADEQDAAVPEEVKAAEVPTPPTTEPVTEALAIGGTEGQGILTLRKQLFEGIGASLNEFMRGATRDVVKEKYRISRALLKEIESEINYRHKHGEDSKALYPLRYDVDSMGGVFEHHLMTHPEETAPATGLTGDLSSVEKLLEIGRRKKRGIASSEDLSNFKNLFDELREKWKWKGADPSETYRQYQESGRTTDTPRGKSSEEATKAAILEARKNGPSPEFKALFGGIDPALVGTTHENVAAFAETLGIKYEIPKATAPATREALTEASQRAPEDSTTTEPERPPLAAEAAPKQPTVAKPAETPVVAAAKVESEVKDVARTEGQRPAKAVKSELVERLEKVIEDAPEVYDVSKSKNVTIEIPGDGTFTVVNSKETLRGLLARAKRISTNSGSEPAKIPSSRGGVEHDAEGAIKAYGSAEEAYRRVRQQMESLESDKEREKPSMLLPALYQRTKAHLAEVSAATARDRVATYKEGAKGFEESITKIEKVKRQTQAHKDRLQDLRERYAQNQKFITNNEREAEKFEQEAAKEKAKLELPAKTTSKGIGGGIKSALEKNQAGEAGFINIDPLKDLLDGVSRGVKASIEAVSEAGKEAFSGKKMTDYRRSVLNWSMKLQRSFQEAHDAQKEIKTKVPDPIRREGITNWIQADGDAAVLRSRAAASNPKLKKGYEAALSLTPEELAVARDAKRAYDAFGRRANRYGILNTFKQNYVTQIWDLGRKAPSGGASSRTLRDKFRFSKASTFPTFFDGEQAGFTPKTKDISKLLPVYIHEMNSVIAARQLVEQMAGGVASDGRPLLAPRGVGMPVDDAAGNREATLVMPKAIKEGTKDYRTLGNQSALTDWRWAAEDADGKPIFLKGDLAIHPEAFDKFKNVLGKSAISEWYNSKTSAGAAIPKALVKGLDLGQSEVKRTMLGLFAPFHQVQEGTHAVGHRVNPFFNIPKVDLIRDAAQADAAKHGLMMLPDRASEQQFMEGFRHSGLVSRIPGIGAAADWYSHYLFHEYIPGLKYKTYRAILDRNMKVFESNLRSGEVAPEDVKVLSAEQANAAYGHLNYADLGRNPTVQHMMRLGLLAPDFLEARGRFAGQALKGLTTAKAGREQLLALATLAIAQTVASYTAAKLTGGDWDAKHPFEFVKGNRRYRMRSVPEDAFRLVTDTRAFIYARLNPIIGKGAVQYLSGVDWRGQKKTALQTTKELAQQPVPLTLRGFVGLGNTPLNEWEQLASAVGIPISRYSAQNEVYKRVDEFKKNSKDPKLVAEFERRQKETMADSDYKPLREALEKGDTKGAKQAYADLLKTKKADLINRAMQPYTVAKIPGTDYWEQHSKPFTGSKLIEQKFVKSLSPEDKAIYAKAKAEREERYRQFKAMLKQR